MVTTIHQTIPDAAEALLTKNQRVNRQQVEEALKVIRTIFGDRKPSEPRARHIHSVAAPEHACGRDNRPPAVSGLLLLLLFLRDLGQRRCAIGGLGPEYFFASASNSWATSLSGPLSSSFFSRRARASAASRSVLRASDCNLVCRSVWRFSNSSLPLRPLPRSVSCAVAAA